MDRAKQVIPVLIPIVSIYHVNTSMLDVIIMR
jgi:hypothetical protein